MESKTEIAVSVAKSPRKAFQIALSKLNKPLKLPDKGIEKFIIKPSIYDPKLVGNTNPHLILAIVKTFHTIAPILIVESDNPLRKTTEAFKEMGYETLLDNKAELFDLSSAPLSNINMAGYSFKKRKVPSILLESFFLINVATLKLEPNVCIVGGSIKNLFGLLPECDKSIYHENIDNVLLDLLIAFKPDLTIVDLTELVIGSRKDGITREVNGIIVGTDPVAVDAYCFDLLGIDPLSVPYIRKAFDLKLGQAMLENIRVCGTQSQIEKLYSLVCKE